MGDDITTQRWRINTPCKQHPELFFPAKHEVRKIARALEICGRCPVRTPCRTHAIVHLEKWGIWGGTTEQDRTRLRRSRTTAA